MVIYSGFSHWKLWFSIAMLVYQRVYPLDVGGLPWIAIVGWMDYDGPPKKKTQAWALPSTRKAFMECPWTARINTCTDHRFMTLPFTIWLLYPPFTKQPIQFGNVQLSLPGIYPASALPPSVDSCLVGFYLRLKAFLVVALHRHLRRPSNRRCSVGHGPMVGHSEFSCLRLVRCYIPL